MKIEYALTMYGTWQGRTDSHIKAPVEGVRDGSGYLPFILEAGEKGWELCGVIPASTIGSKRAIPNAKDRRAETEFEVFDLIFKRVARGISKQEQFLWMVQTRLLANAVNLASDPNSSQQFRHEISATRLGFNTSEAVYASERIPEDMDAIDAADDFCEYMLSNLRPEGMDLPYWFARGYAFPSSRKRTTSLKAPVPVESFAGRR